MQSVSSRIEQLERATGAGACEVCGRDAAGKFTAAAEVEIHAGTVEPQACPRCGRPGIIVTLNISGAGGKGCK